MEREEQLKLAKKNFADYQDNLRREKEDEFIADWTPMPIGFKLFYSFLAGIIIGYFL